ncbi:MAG: DUF4342 domain-containing protein [Candidatus Aminicenantes bacterium]|nr:DUF4342 domain-containing protein [Candidatus Aminicenantes bacterium]
MAENQKTRFNVSGDDLVNAVKKIIHEGNIRRVRLLQGEKPLIDIPLTIGASAAVITVLAAPVLAAVAVIAALVSECTIEVEKIENPKD